MDLEHRSFSEALFDRVNSLHFCSAFSEQIKSSGKLVCMVYLKRCVNFLSGACSGEFKIAKGKVQIYQTGVGYSGIGCSKQFKIHWMKTELKKRNLAFSCV